MFEHFSGYCLYFILSHDMAEGGRAFSFIPSQRNKNKLAYNGFIYVCDRKNENKSYWKCEISDCKGRCIKHDNVIEETKVHCHGPDPVNIEVE